MNKKGISIVSLSIVIIILLILVSTISVSVTYSVANAKKMTFAKEIYDIQSLVSEYIENEDSLPTTTESIQIKPSDVSQFSAETIVDGEIMLEVLDLQELGIKNAKYGNKELGDTEEEKSKDIYAILPSNGKVYYIAGFKTSDKTYYTLTEDLLRMIDRKQDIVISESTITFMPSRIGWSNEGVSLRVTVPSDYTSPSISINNANITYTTETADGITYYNVNTAKVVEAYTVTVSYTKDGKSTSVSYTEKIDIKTPTISKDETKENKENQINNLIAEDTESGIRYFKYVEGVIDIADAKSYMNAYGRNVNKGTIKFVTKRPYTLYAEDKAGNYSVMYIDEDGNLTTTKPKEYSYPIIPDGFTASIYPGETSVSKGLVIYETNSLEGIDQETAMTTYNQFVWVPVEDINDFALKTWTGTDPASDHIDANLEKSVQKNKGFYIARYETGKEGTDTPVSKKGVQPFTNVAFFYTSNTAGLISAPKYATKMYEDWTSIKSMICQGVQWDAALTFISQTTDSEYPYDALDKGNYETPSGTYARGTVQPTGYYAVNNIFDMAGNVLEWTTEQFSTNNMVIRGGCIYDYLSTFVTGTNSNGAGHRQFANWEKAGDILGFRVCLYINNI